LAGALALTFTGCGSLGKKKQKKPDVPDMADQNNDTSFQSFLGRLRKAADKHDSKTMMAMMAPDFGFSWAPGGEGPGVFDYWERYNVWPEVSAVLRQKFAPYRNYMVAPRQVAFDPEYKGFRAGLRLVNGSWRFCYFVGAPPPSAAATSGTQ